MPFLSLSSFFAGVGPDAQSPTVRSGGLRADAPVFMPRGLRLPAVVSVKKSASKGCAVVLLRDPEVLERSVRQRVAVVDNVCVEVRRHSRKEREIAAEEDAGEATPTTACSSRESSPHSAPDAVVGGVFCAWGHRVERRMPVSAEGLEAYFNGLAGAPMPKDLDAEPPFEEQLQRYPLTSSGPVSLDAKPKEDSACAERLLESPHSDESLVRALWDAKETLDSLWSKPPPPMGRNLCQRVARDQLFPHSGKEGRDGAREREHENRAGEKLAELVAASDLLQGVPEGSSFLDLCGGPGAWSQFLLARRELALRGYGFTLRSSVGDGKQDWQAEEKDDWYPELFEEPSWQALWGADGTGDLLKLGNLESCCRKLKEAGGVFLCVADGGFSDHAIPANQLELYFYRLFLAELLTAASCLQEGGRFVCKLYSAYSSHTAGLLLLTTRLFESVAVCKPQTSRVAGPERYLVARGFKGDTQEVREVRAALERSHVAGGGQGVMKLPLLSPIVPPEALAKETEFVEGLKSMVHGLCKRQTLALTSIMERAEVLEEMALDAAARSAEVCPAPGRETWRTEAAPASRYADCGSREERREQRRQERREKVAEGSPRAHARHQRAEQAAPRTPGLVTDAGRDEHRAQRRHHQQTAADEKANTRGRTGKNRGSRRSWNEGSTAFQSWDRKAEN